MERDGWFLARHYRDGEEQGMIGYEDLDIGAFVCPYTNYGPCRGNPGGQARF